MDGKRLKHKLLLCGHKNYANILITAADTLGKLQTVHITHTNIEKQYLIIILAVAFQKILCTAVMTDTNAPVSSIGEIAVNISLNAFTVSCKVINNGNIQVQNLHPAQQKNDDTPIILQKKSKNKVSK